LEKPIIAVGTKCAKKIIATAKTIVIFKFMRAIINNKSKTKTEKIAYPILKERLIN